MSFLAKALQGGLTSASSTSTLPAADVYSKPEQLGSIRVAVVGEPSVGKTALTELIASGLAARSSTRSTAGCHIHVKLVDSSTAAAAAAAGDALQAPHDSISSTPGSAGAPSFYAQQHAAATAAAAAAAALGGGPAAAAQHPAQRKFFVELWDVSGQPKYAALRSVFYKQLNGVILVYDVTRQASLARLAQWAAEVAADGSFVAPLADEAAALNVGGLPVPVLLVGNKADRLGFTSRLGGSGSDGSSSSAAAFLSSACAQLTLLQGPLRGCGGGGGWPQRLVHRLTRGAWCAPPQRPPSQSGMAAAAAEAGLGGGGQHLLGLTASAAAGQVDWDALNGFLTGLWERRYQPAAAAAAAAAGGGSALTGLSGAYHHRHTLSAGVVPLPGGGDVGALLLGGSGGGLGGTADAADARLDDSDWV